MQQLRDILPTTPAPEPAEGAEVEDVSAQPVDSNAFNQKARSRSRRRRPQQEGEEVGCPVQ